MVGVGAAIAQPAEFSLVPVAAGGRRLSEVNGLVESARYAGMTIGPLAGGALAAAGQVELALLLDAATFAAVAIAAALLHARRQPRTRRRRQRPRPRGLRRAGRRPGAARDARRPRSARSSFFSMSITAEIFYVKDVLGAERRRVRRPRHLLVGGMVFGAVALARRVPPARWPSPRSPRSPSRAWASPAPPPAACCRSAFAGFTLGGVAHGVKNVLLRTLIHERVPESLRGRGFALYNAARNGAELAALALGGVLVGAIGAQTALLLSGAIPLAIGLAALLFITTPTRRTANAYEG